MPDVEPDVTIAKNIERPRKGQNNMGLFEQHSLPDQIKASQHLKNNQVGDANHKDFLGMLIRVFNVPGTQ